MFACRWFGSFAAPIRRWLGVALMAGVVAAVATATFAQPASRKIALLIANGTYPTAGATILTASKDAHLLRDELERAQFDTTLQENPGRQAMQAAVTAFTAKITPGSVALLYFTGFGIQADHRTYLIPTDAEIGSEDDVKRNGIDLDAVLSDMDRHGAQVKLVILDASRRDPFERRFRGFFAGLADVQTPGTLALYAAAPGRLSVEDTGDISLFMGELTKEVRSPGISAEEVFAHTRIGVSRASNGQQIPWVASSLLDDFSFGQTMALNPQPQAPAPVPSAPPPPAVETAASKPSQPEPAEPVSAPQVIAPQVIAPQLAAVPVAAPPADPKSKDHLRDCADCPEMIALPPGSFEMGTRSTPFDRPVHKVVIAKSFAMAATETTFADWERCAAAGGCTFRPNDQGWGAGDRPVVNVSWADAHQYTAWLSKQTGHAYRLPSEAEWEYAARGSHPGVFAWGAVVGVKMANCRDCQAAGGLRTMPVRSFSPNDFGLFDMAGNAAEWVEDCWNDTYAGAPHDGSPWTTGHCELRVLRGGSFDSTAAYVKPAARFRYDADVRYYANGFRVARTLP